MGPLQLPAGAAVQQPPGLACSFVKQPTHTLLLPPQIADVVVYTPSDWAPAKVSELATTLTTSPQTVFTDEFRAQYPEITSFTVTPRSALPPATPPAAGGLTQAAQIGIGVGVGAGGALLVAVVAGVIIARRRRSVVEPRDRLAGSV